MDILAYALAKKYTSDTADSLGSLKGAPATIKSVTEITGGHRITFEWTGTSGAKQTQTLDVMDGEQGPQGEPGPQGEQGPAGPQGEKGADGTMSFDDLTPEQKASLKGDPGEKGETGEKGADGAKGDDGYSPTITVTEITGGHRVTVMDAEGSDSFDVMDGEGGKADSVDWSKVSNKPTFAAVAESGSYNDLEDQPTIPAAYDDTALSDRVTANATAIADRYTKTETDAKIAEAMTDVDNEHFHPVTVLPDIADEDPKKRPKENHEYILIEYEQDGTTIKSETHYLFYGGEYHQKSTGGVSLEGYATEDFVNTKTEKMGEFDVTSIPQGPTGANEINAVLSNKDSENARVSYVRQSDGTLPNTVNLGVKSGLGEDSFELTTPAYVNLRSAFTIVQNTTTPQEIWQAINMGRALMFRTANGITKSVISANAGTTTASFICATDSGEGIVVWSVDSNAVYTLAVTTFATDAELVALDTRVTGVESQFNTRDYIFADALLLDVDLPHTMPWSEFSAMGFPQSTHQENTVYNVVTFNGNYDKEYPKIRYFNDSQEGSIKTIRYKMDERQSSVSSEETLVVEYDIANQTATITTGGTAGISKSHIKVYSPRSVYGVSGKVSEDFDLRVLEEAATHSEVATGVAEAKVYADGKALVTQTGWGVVTTGRGEIGSAGNPKVIDVSQYNFASADDYEVAVTSLNNNCNVACTEKTATSFTVVGSGWGQSVGERPFSYVLTAKGYGAVAYTGEIPTGGTSGQVLTKRSDADGDYGWQNNLPSYIVDKPEGSSPVSGNVVQVGSFVNTDGTEYGIYEFYYKTSALPAADTTKTYSFSPLLDDYTIFDFIDQSGITSNGHVISSGRTDGTNRIIIQQFSKNNKNVMLRAYGDYTAQTALLRIKFIGTKNA